MRSSQDPAAPVGDHLLLLPPERHVLAERNETTHDTGVSATLVDLFDEQVATRRDAVALDYEGRQWTYGEFDSSVNRLARHLISLGVGPEDRVALAVRRSPELLVGMYAIAKTGAAYVPVDPEQPAERNAYILDTAAPAAIVTTSTDPVGHGQVRVVELDRVDLSDVADTQVTDIERTAPLRPDHTAYVIFTSGSTGRPKGVAVPHAAIVNQLLWKRSFFGLGPDDAVLLKTAATFDLSVWEFWSALTSGARLVVATADGHQDPDYLLGLLRDQQRHHVAHRSVDAVDAHDRGGGPAFPVAASRPRDRRGPAGVRWRSSSARRIRRRCTTCTDRPRPRCR